ncbi:MAG: selenide, water dikinase SelD, partial [Acidimicrobiales bacterium]
RRLTPSDDPRLLVGTASGDDAAVWRMTDDRALVVTTDFITPVVDDARTWGRVAAANAVSDVYAMGGRPLLALNLVCWNTDELSTDLLSEVLGGGQDVAADAGFVVAGGHTVDDPEPKYGMAVVGEVHPERMLTNEGLRPGQLLVLSKPLGIGVITTAIKRGLAEPATTAAAIESMTLLNAEAAATALGVGATGATDVTGFGLLGHGGQMAARSGVGLEIWSGSVPIIEGARALAEAGAVPGGTGRNLEWISERLVTDSVDETTVTLLADAQTSGGLLFGVDPERVDESVARLEESGHRCAVIGRCVAGDATITVRPAP